VIKNIVTCLVGLGKAQHPATLNNSVRSILVVS